MENRWKQIVLASCTVAAATSMLASSPALAAGSETAPANKPQARTQQWWIDRHDQLNARAKRGGADLVFLGDSITQGWETAGQEVWERRYGNRNALNLGISGDQTQHLLWRLDHGNLDGISPKVVVLMIGTNNSHGEYYTAEQIADGIEAIVKKLKSKLPRAKVLLLAVFPRGEKPDSQREKVAKASRLSSRLADGDTVHYLDIGSRFLGQDGTISKSIMPDYLHLSPSGYEIWAEAIEAKLVELLGDQQQPEGPGQSPSG